MYSDNVTLRAVDSRTAAAAAPDALRLRDFIFHDANLAHYRDNLLQGIALVQKSVAAADKPFSGILPSELAEQFRTIDLDRPLANLDETLAEIGTLYLRHAVYFHHPHYVAHLNCPIVIPAILAELVLSSINSSVDTWDQSAGGTLIEQKLLDWTAGRIGFGERADGIFTSGGTQSNLMAMLLARDRCAGLGHDVKTRGLPDDYRKLRVFTSETSHFSVQKAAAILGLGYDAVVQVPCDRYFRMDASALTEALDRAAADGLTPMAVVATAGTTDFGSIDPLVEIAALCRRRGVWLHVDAAYGCGLLVSGKFRHLLAGIEQADSVTVDYHKSFLQPVSCSALLVKDRRHLSAVTHHADYLNPLSQAGEGTPNLVDKSLQTTKRFDALKLWLTLRTMGADALGEAFDHNIHLAKQAYLLLLSEPCIEVLHQPQLSTLVFRYRPLLPEASHLLDAANLHIRKSLFRSGEAVIAGTKVRGRYYLKFTLLNPMTTLHDLQAIVKAIVASGRQYFVADTESTPFCAQAGARHGG